MERLIVKRNLMAWKRALTVKLRRRKLKKNPFVNPQKVEKDSCRMAFLKIYVFKLLIKWI